MAAEIVEVVHDPYADRYLGRTKKQKETEASIRDDERNHWISVLTKLGDGRANRTATKEQRAAYRKAAALLAQNQE